MCLCMYIYVYIYFPSFFVFIYFFSWFRLVLQVYCHARCFIYINVNLTLRHTSARKGREHVRHEASEARKHVGHEALEAREHEGHEVRRAFKACSYIFHSHFYVYIYVCTLCVYVCPLDTGHELDVQQDFQKSSCLRNVLCAFRMRAVPRQVHISSFDS